MRRLRIGTVLACALLLACGLGWGAGFLAFNQLVRRSMPVPEAADGIVVLTGGADRIETAMRLLTEQRAPRLLVSGVGRGLDVGDLARRLPLSAEQVESITLGRTATSTLGNAAEAASWAHANRLRSLIVVTAGYHMPRALLEIKRALPEVALYPMPVQSPALRRGLEFATLRLIANEFDKYLVVRLGLIHRSDAGS